MFGNNGTHTLGKAISTGTGASLDVLSALIPASDHLPVVADYVIPEPTTVVVMPFAGMLLLRRSERHL